ncbi:MAG: TolC family protein [Pseudobdellovibrio sp.]
MFSSLSKINRVFIFISVFLFLAELLADNHISLKFEDFYVIARNNDYETKQNLIYKEYVETHLNKMKSAFYPKFGIESRYEHFNSTSNSEYGSTANAYLEWNLFNGFRDRLKLNLLRTDVGQADYRIKRSEINFKGNLLALYSRGQALQNIITAYANILETNNRYISGIKSRKKSGLVTESQLIEFELFNDQLRNELSAYQAEQAVLLDEIKNISGIIGVRDFSSDLSPQPLKLKIDDLDKILGHELSQQRDLIVDLEKTHQELMNTKLVNYPIIDLRISNGREGLRETTSNNETSLSIVAKWEFFSGFESLNEYRMNSIKLKQGQMRLDLERNQLKNQVIGLIKNIENIIMRLQFEKSIRQKNERYFKLITDEYRRGTKSSSDLKSAIELMLENQVKINTLKSDYYRSIYLLERIIGQSVVN